MHDKSFSGDHNTCSYGLLGKREAVHKDASYTAKTPSTEPPRNAWLHYDWEVKAGNPFCHGGSSVHIFLHTLFWDDAIYIYIYIYSLDTRETVKYFIVR